MRKILKKIETLLKIECADGKDLPYEGFIEVDLEIQGISESIETLLLIVPESQCNSRIPLL